MKKIVISLAVLFACAICSAAQVKERVRFATGSTAAVRKGAVTGYAYHDYMVGARRGQTLEVKLTSTGSPSVFTVFRPGGDNLEGAAEMDDADVTLPTSGDYVVRVLMMRSAARRRGSRSNYTIRISAY